MRAGRGRSSSGSVASSCARSPGRRGRLPGVQILVLVRQAGAAPRRPSLRAVAVDGGLPGSPRKQGTPIRRERPRGPVRRWPRAGRDAERTADDVTAAIYEELGRLPDRLAAPGGVLLRCRRRSERWSRSGRRPCPRHRRPTGSFGGERFAVRGTRGWAPAHRPG